MQDDRYEVVGLVTTVSAVYRRISMHGVRESLLESQARVLDLPVAKTELPEKASNEIYETAFAKALGTFRARGVAHVGFGDILLEDIKAYRERQLNALNMRGVFPIWQCSTAALARRFIDSGFKAILTCVDGEGLNAGFAGREYDDALLADLPDTVDPCGENGEFHTFVYDGPLLAAPIGIKRGERVTRDERFHYCDLELA
jgi:uncharacterized protein (TIGR00290 family)